MTKHYEIFIKLCVCMLVKIYIVELALSMEHILFQFVHIECKVEYLDKAKKPTESR